MSAGWSHRQLSAFSAVIQISSDNAQNCSQIMIVYDSENEFHISRSLQNKFSSKQKHEDSYHDGGDLVAVDDYGDLELI